MSPRPIPVSTRYVLSMVRTTSERAATRITSGRPTAARSADSVVSAGDATATVTVSPSTDSGIAVSARAVLSGIRPVAAGSGVTSRRSTVSRLYCPARVPARSRSLTAPASTSSCPRRTAAPSRAWVSAATTCSTLARPAATNNSPSRLPSGSTVRSSGRLTGSAAGAGGAGGASWGTFLRSLTRPPPSAPVSAVRCPSGRDCAPPRPRTGRRRTGPARTVTVRKSPCRPSAR